MAATIRITPTAWMKMQTLVMGYDKEVGWFGTCEQVAPLEFRIKDILVFPQYTSGCFIDDERDDPLEFRKWLDTLDDDTYNSRRLWGHSHVNMSTYPSGTDSDMFKRFAHTSCAALDNRFAICVILNKRMDMYWKVFDAATNKEYEKNEINIMIEVDDEGMTNLEYFESTKHLVRDIRPTTAFIYNYGYGGYRGGVFGANHEQAEGYNYGIYNSTMNKKVEPKKTTTHPPVAVVPTKTGANKDEENKDKKQTPTIASQFYEDEDDWSDFYRLYSSYDDDDIDDDVTALEELCVAYDVEITKDDVIVRGLHSTKSIDPKKDMLFEDEISGITYRIKITDEELDNDHPADNDSLLMVMIDEMGDGAMDSTFSVWEDAGDDHEIAVIPYDERDVIDMMLSPVIDVRHNKDHVEFMILETVVDYTEVV